MSRYCCDMMAHAVEQYFFLEEEGTVMVYNDRSFTPGLPLAWCPFCRSSLKTFVVDQQITELKTRLEGIVTDVYADSTLRVRLPYGWKIVKRDEIDG